MKKKINLYLLALVPFCILILLYEVVPLLSIIFKSFQPTKAVGFTLEQYITAFSKPLYQRALLNSLQISICSAILGIIIAFFGAKAVQSVNSSLKRFFTLILNVTSNFCGVPLAFSFMLLLGNAGVLIAIAREIGWQRLAEFNLYSRAGLNIIYIYFQIPLATLLMIPAFNAIRKEWLESARLLNASAFRFWLTVAVPVLIPSLLGTLGTLFANALAGYATAYGLMASNYSLLPINIATMFSGDIVIRKELGSALSVIVMSLMFISTMLNNYIVKKTCRWARGD